MMQRFSPSLQQQQQQQQQCSQAREQHQHLAVVRLGVQAAGALPLRWPLQGQAAVERQAAVWCQLGWCWMRWAASARCQRRHVQGRRLRQPCCWWAAV
jgi:hypothetical protein